MADVFLLSLESGLEYPLPAGLSINQRHVGGAPRVRFVRPYGRDVWWSVQDRRREPDTIDLVGTVFTDRNESLIRDLLNELNTAAQSAVALVHATRDGVHVEHLPLLGALGVTAEPDGIDGTLLNVTLPLVPAVDEWEPGSPGEFLLLDTGGVMLTDTGARALKGG